LKNTKFPLADTPPVSVVISTYNRGDSIIGTIQSILLNDYPHFKIIIVDQSENDLTETSLQPFLNNPSIHYIRTAMRGVSIGRNLGIANAENEFIAITDDDCETPKNWVSELANALIADSRIGIVFGNVLPGPHDHTAGFIPIYVRNNPFLARSISEKYRANGLAACMGLRRSVWQKLNGFDEMLGWIFKGAEDVDFTVRTLMARYFVYETPKLWVVHHGFRNWKQGLTLIQNYSYGTGAMFAKYLKCGYWSVARFLLHLTWRWGFGRSQMPDGLLIPAGLGNRPYQLLRLAAFAKGFLAGVIKPVDRTTGHYVCNGKKTVK
jgi:GT2 family glycosyltransferase